MAVMARESWTDERLDDLKEHMDEGFREVRAEIRSTRSELKEDIRELSRRFDRLNYTLIAGLLGLLATHYLG
jgi:intein/homing endonuclease